MMFPASPLVMFAIRVAVSVPLGVALEGVSERTTSPATFQRFLSSPFCASVAGCLLQRAERRSLCDPSAPSS